MALRDIANLIASYWLDLILITEYQSFIVRNQPSITAPTKINTRLPYYFLCTLSLLRIVVNNPALYIISRDFMVSVEGVEPSILPASGLKPDVYASSTTRPYKRRLGTGRHSWIYLLPANQAGSAHDITEPTKELRFYLVLLTFNL